MNCILVIGFGVFNVVSTILNCPGEREVIHVIDMQLVNVQRQYMQNTKQG